MAQNYKLSDVLQSIQNSQIRIALEQMMLIVGVDINDRVDSIKTMIANVTGNLTGNVTGDVAGDVVGDVTGDVSGIVTKTLQTISADTDLDDEDFTGDLIDLNGSSASADVTKFTPTPGRTYVMSCSSVATADPTVTASAGITLDGTNSIATFDAADECLIIVCINATTCLIVENIGGVVMS